MSATWLLLAQDLTATTPEAAPGLSEGTLLALAIIPTLLILASAFIKAAVVLNVLRGAFGSSINVPPAIVITALAFLLAILVMLPVIDATLIASQNQPTPNTLGQAVVTVDHTSGPFLDFLERNATPESVERFSRLAQSSPELQSELSTSTTLTRLRILLPAFIVSELTAAFLIGFLLLLPFIVIDLLVAALLQGAGLSTVQPHTIALPLKLLVFVLVGGWQLLIEGLLSGYT